MPPAGWLDRHEYPFAPHDVAVEAGTLHYVDEGDGAPIVMVHGTPDWSFVYRNVIKALAPRFRCVVPDNLGFGLSERPRGYSYLPELQGRVSALVREFVDAPPAPPAAR
jgi:haloalkane dehalogenase